VGKPKVTTKFAVRIGRHDAERATRSVIQKRK
jgi:hypothetical protein